MSLAGLAAALRAGHGLAHKADIGGVTETLARLVPGATADVPLGDDCAAIPDGRGGHLLLAIEGFLDEFVAADPCFAGWCGVMVNLSDVAAMGGRAVAVAVLGRAGPDILSSFAARPGDRLMTAIDLRGRYREPHPYWDAASGAPAERLRGDLDVLPALAEAGLCAAAKDISMGGLAGTAVMLMECSGTPGGVIDVAAVPRPEGVPLDRWLASFPSFGFILSVAEAYVEAVAARFAARGIACAPIGALDDLGVLRLRDGGEEATFWDLREAPLIGGGHVAA